MKKNEIELAVTAIRLEALREALEAITGGDGDAREIGIRASMLALMAGCSPCRTQRDLASRLCLSPGRVSQMRRSLNRFLSNYQRQTRLSG
jgi:hypothetical protein